MQERSSVVFPDPFGPRNAHRSPRSTDRLRLPAIRMPGYSDPILVSEVLETQSGIRSRSGLHCAPLAHKTMGTFEGAGTTRLSFGPFITEADVRYAAGALTELAKTKGLVGANR